MNYSIVLLLARVVLIAAVTDDISCIRVAAQWGPQHPEELFPGSPMVMNSEMARTHNIEEVGATRSNYTDMMRRYSRQEYAKVELGESVNQALSAAGVANDQTMMTDIYEALLMLANNWMNVYVKGGLRIFGKLAIEAVKQMWSGFLANVVHPILKNLDLVQEGPKSVFGVPKGEGWLIEGAPVLGPAPAR
eukprot:gnl/TRDRNA2_/TRDRNA2_43625_c0_seq1.p1 gnl/TRDRNA2_/TRDRNA2_43625_c0~~gnl/TRDRNA2_/TRDRNA2_43625_c0_seq1.p1  ORF type:complete len:191 (+),score=23.57 gnl/TRDRNA2_/TRDRNA2_43625_c0_seq1:87-659(+)